MGRPAPLIRLEAISKLSFASVSKQVKMIWRLKILFHANQTLFHMNVFARTRFETEAEGNSKLNWLIDHFETIDKERKQCTHP